MAPVLEVDALASLWHLMCAQRPNLPIVPEVA